MRSVVALFCFDAELSGKKIKSEKDKKSALNFEHFQKSLKGKKGNGAGTKN